MAIDTSYNFAGLARSELSTEFAAWAGVGTHLLDQLDTAVAQAGETLDLAYQALQSLHSAVRAEGTSVPTTFTAYIALRLAWIDGELRRFREARRWFESSELRDCIEHETLLKADVYNYRLSYGITLATLGQHEGAHVCFDRAITVAIQVADHAGVAPVVHAYVATFHGMLLLEDWNGLLNYVHQAQQALLTMPQFTEEVRPIFGYVVLKHRAYAYRGLGRTLEARTDGQTLLGWTEQSDLADPNNEWRVFLKRLSEEHLKRVESGEIKVHVPNKAWYASPFVILALIYFGSRVAGSVQDAQSSQRVQQTVQSIYGNGASYVIKIISSSLEAEQTGNLYFSSNQTKISQLRGIDYTSQVALIVFSPVDFAKNTYLSNLRTQREGSNLQVIADLHQGDPIEGNEREPYILVVPQDTMRNVYEVYLLIDGRSVSSDSILR